MSIIVPKDVWKMVCTYLPQYNRSCLLPDVITFYSLPNEITIPGFTENKVTPVLCTIKTRCIIYFNGPHQFVYPNGDGVDNSLFITANLNNSHDRNEYRIFKKHNPNLYKLIYEYMQYHDIDKNELVTITK